MKVAVHLHGPFRRFSDGPVYVEAETAAQAIEAVTMQIEGFRPDLNGHKRVRVKGFEKLEELHSPLTTDELHLMPPVSFGKDGGAFEAILGVVLIVIGYIYPPLGAYLIPAGIGLLIGGILQMMAPQPALSIDEEEERSRYLGGPGNTVGIGQRIPIAYGRNLWAGHYLSLNVQATDVGV